MIRFSLRCADDHRFDSWFQSSAAFDKLQASGLIACAVCGSGTVDKALMAPAVSTPDAPEHPARPEPHGPLSAPASPAEQALRAMRAHLEKNSSYVGRDFAREARAMHDGTAPERAIHGEARPDEARALIEEGVPIAPIPFRLRERSN